MKKTLDEINNRLSTVEEKLNELSQKKTEKRT